MSPTPESEKPTDTNSVAPVLFRLPPNVDSGPERKSASVKCSECKVITAQEWVKLTPAETAPVDPMELLKLSKRLTVCTVCGTMKLIT